MERSQHEWISLHHELVPVFVLVATPSTCWLISGSKHGLFHESFSAEAIEAAAICSFPREALRSGLVSILRQITDRGRSDGAIS
jgi:hypothetical protein